MTVRPRALVTGASAGIGAEIARVLAKRGYDLIINARREENLRVLAAALPGADVVVIPQDLSEPDGARQLFDAVERRKLRVDLLVNNAGIAHTGAFKDMSSDTIARMVALNISTVTTLTRLFLDGMIARKTGRILNVASLAAFQPVPALTVYAASKAFVLSFTEALSEELTNTGVSATALCPGLTNTDMAHQIATTGGGTRQIPRFLLADVAAVAQAGVAACLGGEVVHIPGVANRFTAFWTQIQPRWLIRALGGFVGREMLSR